MTSSPTSLSQEARLAKIRRVLWATLALNLLVAGLKIVAGIFSGSTALLADGFHSIFDGVSNIVGLLAVGIAAAPPDHDHPYGHQKIEVAATALIGVLILLAMIEIAREAAAAYHAGSTPTIDALTIGAAVVSLLISAGVSRWESRAGDALNSDILRADAGHTASDALATLAVLGGLALVAFGIDSGDVLATAVVLVFVASAVYKIFRRIFDVLTDVQRVDPDEVRQIADQIDGMISCHAIRSRGMDGHVLLDLHVTFDPKMTLEQAGERMLELKASLRTSFPELQDIVVQLEPHLPEHLPED